MVLVIVNHLILTIENNDFLILGEGPTYGINGSFGSQEKKVSINFSTANTKLCLRLHYNVDNSYLFVNEKEIFKFKADNFCFVSEVYLMDLVLLSLEKYL